MIRELLQRFLYHCFPSRFKGKEIERKYLIQSHSALESLLFEHSESVARITQAYLLIGPTELRIRRSTVAGRTKCTLTLKQGTGLVRSETEAEIPLEAFNELYRNATGSLMKWRHRIGRWEIDVYDDHNWGLTLAETELKYPTEQVVAPDWLKPFIIRDVTGEREYKNQNLAKNLKRPGA